MNQLENMTVSLNIWEKHFDPEEMLREEMRLTGTSCLSIIHYLAEVPPAHQKKSAPYLAEVSSQHTVQSPLWLKGSIEGSCELKVAARQPARDQVLQNVRAEKVWHPD